MLVSHATFIWFVTAGLVATMAYNTVRDSFLIFRQLRRGVRTLEDRDRMFGYGIGLTFYAAALIGVLRYHCF
jgi:hypothetical protein